MAIDVSVIIPTFRRPAQLQESIRSALSQEGVSVEITVIDDSPEGSGAAAVEAVGDERVQYRRMDKPTGGLPSKVRNTAWPSARGRYIHFLDDDDRMEPGSYAAMVAALDARPGVGVVFGHVVPFGDDPGVLAQQRAYFRNASRRARLSWAMRSKYLVIANMLFKPTVIVCSCAMLRKECVAEVGGFDEELKLVEDVDFYSRAIRECGCVFVDRVVLNYRTGAPSLMHAQKDNSEAIRAYTRMFSKYRALHGRMELATLLVIAKALLWWT